MNSIFRIQQPMTPCALSFFDALVPAGFPSPAADYVQNELDLNAYLIEDPVATFFVRVSGDSMKDAGILDGGILVVDAGRAAVAGDVVVAQVDGRFTVKRLRTGKWGFELHAENSDMDYPVIHAREDLQVFGVVVASVALHVQKPATPKTSKPRQPFSRRK